MRPRPTPALVLPDEASLTLWGEDPARHGIEPTFVLARARRVVVVDPLPAGLADAAAALAAQLLAELSVEYVSVPLPGEGRPAQAIFGASPEPAQAAHDHAHGDHGGGHVHDPGGHGEGNDHGDMMAIVGEPSRDGLVMEPMEFEHGPLAPGLPAGLRLAVRLDGDVVSACAVTAELSTGDAAVPDPLTPAAWTMAAARDRNWEQIADVELERALSHATWVRGLARLLGWEELTERCQAAVEGVLRARAERQVARAFTAASALEAVLGSRRLRSRTVGVGRLGEDATSTLAGPNARAAGLARDTRTQDPAYGALGFEPVVAGDGDAYARCLVRVKEIAQALALARRALGQSAAGAPYPAGTPHAVEGPRGPLTVGAGGERLAPGAEQALAVGGAAAIGEEWASALVAVVSFDLSPWRVGA